MRPEGGTRENLDVEISTLVTRALAASVSVNVVTVNSVVNDITYRATSFDPKLGVSSLSNS